MYHSVFLPHSVWLSIFSSAKDQMGVWDGIALASGYELCWLRWLNLIIATNADNHWAEALCGAVQLLYGYMYMRYGWVLCWLVWCRRTGVSAGYRVIVASSLAILILSVGLWSLWLPKVVYYRIGRNAASTIVGMFASWGVAGLVAEGWHECCLFVYAQRKLLFLELKRPQTMNTCIPKWFDTCNELVYMWLASFLCIYTFEVICRTNGH